MERRTSSSILAAPCGAGLSCVGDQAVVLDSDRVQPSGLVLGGNHVFCTTRMHGDPTRGVVDEDGRCHDFENLYIADTGIFPQCPSVNPMLTGMALARRQALVLADRL